MTRTIALTLTTSLAVAALLAGCGRQSSLVRPDPEAGARPAPRAGAGQAPGRDRRPPETPAPPSTERATPVPSIPSAPVEGTSDPIGRPPPTTPN